MFTSTQTFSARRCSDGFPEFLLQVARLRGSCSTFSQNLCNPVALFHKHPGQGHVTKAAPSSHPHAAPGRALEHSISIESILVLVFMLVLLL